MASREFRVAGDRVSVSALEAAIVSGLQLAVSRRAENEYAAVTSVTSRLTAQYQVSHCRSHIHSHSHRSTDCTVLGQSLSQSQPQPPADDGTVYQVSHCHRPTDGTVGMYIPGQSPVTLTSHHDCT